MNINRMLERMREASRIYISISNELCDTAFDAVIDTLSIIDGNLEMTDDNFETVLRIREINEFEISELEEDEYLLSRDETTVLLLAAA